MITEIQHNLYNESYVYYKQNSNLSQLGVDSIGNILLTKLELIFLNDIFFDEDNYFILELNSGDENIFLDSILTLNEIDEVKQNKIINIPLNVELNYKGFYNLVLPFYSEISSIIGNPLNIYPFEVRLNQYLLDKTLGD